MIISSASPIAHPQIIGATGTTPFRAFYNNGLFRAATCVTLCEFHRRDERGLRACGYFMVLGSHSTMSGKIMMSAVVTTIDIIRMLVPV